MGKKPFSDVYFTGIVRDNLGRKMSKQLGNSPDLLNMIDEIGADAVRFGILIASPAGNDLLWDKASNEQGRNFINKIWNALKLIQLWKGRVKENLLPEEITLTSDWPHRWFEAKLRQVCSEVDQLMAQFKLSEALKTLYTLVWDDYCSWYLEWIKPPYGEKISKSEYRKAIAFAEELMHLLHPFMPFITEEVYHQLKERVKGDDLIVRQTSLRETAEKQILVKGDLLKEVITSIREARAQNQIKPKDPIVLHIESKDPGVYQTITEILKKQVNASGILFGTSEEKGKISVVIGTDKFYITGQVNADTGLQKEIILKDISYYEGFLVSVEKKLGNERFIQNAKPEIIELEKKKQADAQAKLNSLRETLEAL
jgi:valyl-tRNA synthetase